jgi:hypothetical protein
MVHALSTSSKNHPSLKPYITFCNMLVLYGEGLYAPNLKASYLEAISTICNLRMHHFVRQGTYSKWPHLFMNIFVVELLTLLYHEYHHTAEENVFYSLHH